MNMALKLTAAYFDSKELGYNIDEERDMIITGTGGLKNKGNIKLYIVFDDNAKSVGLRSHDYVTFPKEKIQKMYEVCSLMNKEYRWIKFYVDESDNTVSLADDAVLQLENCGEEVFELLFRMISIADEAYPEFMKALWA